MAAGRAGPVCCSASQPPATTEAAEPGGLGRSKAVAVGRLPLSVVEDAVRGEECSRSCTRRPDDPTMSPYRRTKRPYTRAARAESRSAC